MLRGVNKRIIEISDTGSDYFEKALFFVKANSKISDMKLEKEAQKIIGDCFNGGQGDGHVGFLRYTEEKKRSNRRIAVIGVALGIAVTVCTAFLFYYIF